MGLADILSEQARSFSSSVGNTQLPLIESLVAIAWQWMVLAAAIIWLGTLIAESQIFAAFKSEQRAEMVILMQSASQRRQRQDWLWLSSIVMGMFALFWLRLPSVLLHQRLMNLPDWSAVVNFLVTTFEGHLWLARGSLILVALSLLISYSLTTRFRGRAEHRNAAHLSGQRAPQATNHDRRSWGQEQGRRTTVKAGSLQQLYSAGKRKLQGMIAIASALLVTCALASPLPTKEPLPISAAALKLVAFLAVSVWLGRIMYLVFVLAPTSHKLETAEHPQAFLEVFAVIRPPLIQLLVAPLLYATFFLETHQKNWPTPAALLNTPAGWVISGELALMAGAILLTLYQKHRALPHLAGMIWLAAQGSRATAYSGIDVSHSLQISQNERQALTQQAKQRLRRALVIQTLLGLCMLLGLVIAPLIS